MYPAGLASVDERAARGLRIGALAMTTTSNGHTGATARFGDALRDKPLRASVGLGVEYAMFASAVGLAATLFATRVPLRITDRVLGTRLRDRFVELLARVSPG
jgi:hypothetical protein